MKNIDHLEKLKYITNAKMTLETSRLREKAFTRNRKMSFPNALSFLMDMRKTTLQTRLNLYFKQTEGGVPISQQAFSKLRMNFDHTPFEKMVREPVEEEYSGKHELPLWNGYHVLAVDGSYLQLPRSDSLRKEFGVRGGGSLPSAGISVLYDVLHGWVLDPIITHNEMNEREECKKHISFLTQQLPQLMENSILTLDRGYPSRDLFKMLQESGLKFVARCSIKAASEITNAAIGDSTLTLKNGVPIRVIKFLSPSGDIKILATNIFDLPEEVFPELYSLRWCIETAYFRLKKELSVEKFSGKTPNTIRQDFWASMALLNVVATFQKNADEEIRNRQEHKPIKHVNRARTSDLIITLRDRFIFAVLCGHPMLSDIEMEDVINTMARVVSPARPGRHFDRSPRPTSNTSQNLKSFL